MEDDLITQEPTLREQLAENLAAVETTPEAAPTPENIAGAETQSAATETPEQKAGRTAGRARDENGRLLPGKPATAQPPSKAPTTAEAPSVVAVAPKRPTTWKKETWPIYDKLAAGQALTPEETKQIVDTIHQREGDFAKGISTYKQEWDQAKPILDAIAPFQAELDRHGIHPANWINNLGTAHHTLALGHPQEKMAMMQRLFHEYGIPAQIAVQGQDGNWQLLAEQPRPQQQQQPQFNPQDIERLVDQRLQSVTIKQTVQQFEAEVETKYPHYAEVRQDMAGLLQAGLAEDLPSAYAAAVRLPKHADIFESLQQQQRQQDDAQAKQARQAQVARARSNVSSVPSSIPTGATTNGGEKGLRQELTENLRSISSGRV